MRSKTWVGLLATALSYVSTLSGAFEPWEHRDAGDKGFDNALKGLHPADRDLVEKGLGPYFSKGDIKHRLWVGTSGSTASSQGAARWFSYGDLIATYGDFRETVDELQNTPENRLDVLQQITRGDFKPSSTGNDFKPLGKGKGKADGITDFDPKYISPTRKDAIGDEARTFVLLAQWNETHFSDAAVLKYQEQHNKALDLIYESVVTKSPQKFLDALHNEALGHHGFTDIFAAGHMMVDRRLMLSPLKSSRSKLDGLQVLGYLSELDPEKIVLGIAKSLLPSKSEVVKKVLLGPLSHVLDKKHGVDKVALETKLFLRGLNDGSAHVGYNHKGYKVLGYENEDKLLESDPSAAFWYSFGDGEYYQSIEGKDTSSLRAKTASAVEHSVRSLFLAYADLQKFFAQNQASALVKVRVEHWKHSRDALDALKVLPIYVLNPDGKCAQRQHSLVETVYGSKKLRDLAGLVDDAKFMTNLTLKFCSPSPNPAKLPYYPLIKAAMDLPTFEYLASGDPNIKTGVLGQHRNGMHTCSGGHYLTGVRVDQDRYLCEPGWGAGLSETTWSKVEASGMRACPSGSAMTGLLVSKNKTTLSCAKLNNAGASYVDENTQRGGMHACPFGSVLLGINLEKNHLLCGRPARM